jgi:hypothetical protein
VLLAALFLIECRNLSNPGSGVRAAGGRLDGTLRLYPSSTMGCHKVGIESFQEAIADVKEFASQIYAAVSSRNLAERFNAIMLKKASPGWADHTYSTFPWNHRVGNGQQHPRGKLAFPSPLKTSRIMLRHFRIQPMHPELEIVRDALNSRHTGETATA